MNLDKKVYVVYIQPIFCPNDTLFRKNYESIESFIEYCFTNNYEPNAIFGGWCSDPKYWYAIQELVKKCNNMFGGRVFKFEKNYGKAVIVNYLINKFKELKRPDFQHFLTADSDIIFDKNEPDLFHRLIYAQEMLELRLEKPMGLISLNQKENCCHIDSFTNQNEIIYPYFRKDIIEKFGFPNGVPQGIAGGCLFTSFNTWNAVGGYPVLGVYSGDDGYLILNTYKANRFVVMMKSLSIIHPNEKDEEYQKWKFEQIKRCTGIPPKDLSYDVVYATNYWANRK